MVDQVILDWDFTVTSPSSYESGALVFNRAIKEKLETIPERQITIVSAGSLVLLHQAMMHAIFNLRDNYQSMEFVDIKHDIITQAQDNLDSIFGDESGRYHPNIVQVVEETFLENQIETKEGLVEFIKKSNEYYQLLFPQQPNPSTKIFSHIAKPFLSSDGTLDDLADAVASTAEYDEQACQQIKDKASQLTLPSDSEYVGKVDTIIKRAHDNVYKEYFGWISEELVQPCLKVDSHLTPLFEAFGYDTQLKTECGFSDSFDEQKSTSVHVIGDSPSDMLLSATLANAYSQKSIIPSFMADTQSTPIAFDMVHMSFMLECLKQAGAVGGNLQPLSIVESDTDIGRASEHYAGVAFSAIGDRRALKNSMAEASR